MLRSRPTGGVFAGIVFGTLLGAIVAGVIAWPLIARTLAPWALARLAGTSDVTIGSSSETGSLLELHDVTIEPQDGKMTLSMDRLAVDGGAVRLVLAAIVPSTPLALTIDTPRIAFAQDAFEPEAMRGAEAALRERFGAHALDLHVAGATIALGNASLPGRALVLADVNGTVSVRPEAILYDVAGRQAGAPFTGRARALDGAVVHEWTAQKIDAAALLALRPSSVLTVHAGDVRDLSLTVRVPSGAGTNVRAAFAFANLAGDLQGDRAHPFTGAAGRVTIAGAQLAVSTLTARIDTAAFSALGEVGDLPASPRWLDAGTPQLSELWHVLSTVLAQPNLTDVSLEADAPGIAYAHYRAHDPIGPRAISIVAIDPHVRGVRLDTALAEDRVISGGERTSALAARTSAVAGINGDYFDIGRSYAPQGMLVRGGKLLRSPADRAALAFHRDGRVTFGEYRCGGTLQTHAGTSRISQYNDWPAGYGTVVTPDFGKELKVASEMTFVALDPVDAARGAYRVAAVTPAREPIAARFGVGIGPLDRGALPRLGEVVHYEYRCTPSLDDTVAVLGGGPILLRDGEWYEDPHPPAPDERPVRWPVVALARLADDTLMMVAVDGRHPERAVGMSRPEFADLLKSFGATDAMALDSGGSVTLVSRKPGDAAASVRNRPSDNDGERWISDGLFAYSDAPAPNVTPAPPVVTSGTPNPSGSAATLETIVNPDLPGAAVVTAPPSAAPQPAQT